MQIYIFLISVITWNFHLILPLNILISSSKCPNKMIHLVFFLPTPMRGDSFDS